MEYQIHHSPEEKKFQAEIDGYTAFIEYYIEDNRLNIIHTLVPAPLRNRGIASALVKTGFDYAIANGFEPQAGCAYAKAWLGRHPGYVGIKN